MPGLNVFVNPANIDASLLSAVRRDGEAQRRLFPHVSDTLEQPDPRVLICLRTHSSLQVRACKLGNWTCYVECQTGQEFVPSQETLLRKLEGQAPEFLGLRGIWEELLAGMPGAAFFLAVNSLAGLLAFANDALARLPVYLRQSNTSLALCRDIGLLQSACPENTLNPLYLALNQVFGYVPGRGTVYGEIDTLSGGTLGVCDISSGKLFLSSDPGLRFPEADAAGSQASRLKNLVQAFDGANRELSRSGTPLLALSGGFDSRAILASFVRQDLPLQAVTYHDAQNAASDDVRVASQIARDLRLSHQMLALPREGLEHYRKLFALKRGINYLGVAFFLQFLEAARSAFPQAQILLTGDGGDKVFPCLLPDQKLRDSREFLDHLYAQNAIFPVEDAAELNGVKPAEIDAYLLNLASAYPGRSWPEKYKQFILAERGGRWLYEGEDRNRYFFSHATPFYAYVFYRLAMQIPDAWKRNNRFYRQFLAELSPELSRARIADSVLRPAGLSYDALLLLRKMLRKVSFVMRWRNRSRQAQIDFHSRDWLTQSILDLAATPASRHSLPGAPTRITPEYLANLNRVQLNLLYTNLAIINNGLG